VNETNDNVVVFNNQYTEFNCFSENKERIIYVKASEYSTLFIGNKGTILIMGKINNGNYTLYTNINVNAVDLSAIVTVYLAYVGISIGRDWDQFKKLGWRGAIVTCFVILGTYLCSATIAHIVLLFTGAI
jgi:hypothetical protein